MKTFGRIMAVVSLVLVATPGLALDDVSVQTEGGLEVAAYDGSAWFELSGRVVADLAVYGEDEAVLGDGTELRKACVTLEGGVESDWGYELDVDFADGDADVGDAYLVYRGFRPVRIRAGQLKEFFSIEELTSSKNLTFMERGLPNELAPGRNIGIGAQTHGSMWTASAGVFGEEFDDDSDDEGNEGWGVTGRLTYAPFSEDRKVVHVGAAGSYRVPDSERKIKVEARPESHVTDIEYVKTGKIKNVQDLVTYGVETAVVFGPVSVQGEYVQCAVSTLRDEEDSGESEESLEFSGWYVFGSWFLTGDVRDYDLEDGAFKSVDTRGGFGAVELAARYSVLDLTDGDVEGGEESNITVGLSWYANDHIRVIANYTVVDNDDFADADGDVVGDDDPRILGLRCQVVF